MKKMWMVASMLVLVFALAACSGDKDTPDTDNVEKNEEAGAQIAVVEKFISIAYFDEGTYEDFKVLYADPANVNTEKEFNEFRKSNEAKDMFPVDTDSVEDIKKHLVSKKIDDTNADVYWVKDVKKDKKEDASSVWSVTKVDKDWKLK